MRNAVLATAAAAFLAACGGSVEEPVPVQPAPPPPNASALPAGTDLVVTLDQTIGTETNEVGDRFSATVARPLIAANGATAVPAGARVHGTITALDDSDHPGDQAIIRLDFDRIEINNRTRDFEAAVIEADVDYSADRRERAIEGAVAGAAAGAVLGAVIRGVDLENILAGAAIGAGAGTIISLGVGDVEPALPRGSELRLRTTEWVYLN